MSFFFLFYKIRKQEGGTGLVWGVGISGSVEEVGKGFGRVNIVQILCIHVCKWKNDTCKNYSRNKEGG
jgi:hypothetical protein